MLSVSITSLYEQLSHYFWPALRILALFGTAPVFSEKTVGKKVKIGLALLITFLIGQNLPENRVDIFSVQGIWLGGREIIIGSAMGLVLQLIFVAVRTAGDLMGSQMGLSFATFFDPSGGQNMPVIARFLNILVTMLFLTFNGHLWLLEILMDSFRTLPVVLSPLRANGFWSLLQCAGIIFHSGLMLGFPVIILLLTINFTLGLLNRLTPQLSIFVIGFPLTLTMGMLALLFMMYVLAPFFERVMGNGLENVADVLMYLR
ncbi:flagellar biosynthesis protein FliR [Leclercia adecarboxylata]|nr:flagellar biosynthesis protein FliR [Leclercia adecarboxylata]KMN61767.1 flagellar biosynthesis protein FliR [Leclercia sp. LK8]